MCIWLYNCILYTVRLPASNTVQPFFFNGGWCQERETSYHSSRYPWICRKDVCYPAWALCRQMALLAEPTPSYCLPGFREIYTICTRGLFMHCLLHWKLECALVYPICTVIFCVWRFQSSNYCSEGCDKDDRVLNSGVLFQVRDTIHGAGYHCEADTSDRKLQKKVCFNSSIWSCSLLWLDGLYHAIMLLQYSQLSLLAIALVCADSRGTIGTI